jgi:FK506-binding nuclear protein
LSAGLVIEDLKVGNGPDAKPGKILSVFFVGRLKQNNKQFDACKEGSRPFKFKVGNGEVIKAWDLGLEGMKVNNVSVL